MYSGSNEVGHHFPLPLLNHLPEDVPLSLDLLWCHDVCTGFSGVGT